MASGSGIISNVTHNMMRHSIMPSRVSAKPRRNAFQQRMYGKTEEVDGDEERKEKQWTMEMRKFLKKRNLTTLSLFISDWKLKTYVVPDPTDAESHVMHLTDLVMFLSVTLIAFVMLTLNIGFYLLLFLKETFVGKEAQRFVGTAHVFFNIWGMPGVPFVFACVLILAIAYHEPKKWSRRTMKTVMIFRYLFICTILTYMVIAISYWGTRMRDIPTVIQGGIWQSFDLYVRNRTDAAKKTWELTQLSFECCGVDSFRDFIGTSLQERGVIQCADHSCRTDFRPVIVKAYPQICCNTIKNKVCITAPREDQVWTQGCLSAAVAWISNGIGIMLGLSGINFCLGVAIAVLFVRIDRCTHQYARMGMVDIEVGPRDIVVESVTIVSDGDMRHDNDPPPPTAKPSPVDQSKLRRNDE